MEFESDSKNNFEASIQVSIFEWHFEQIQINQSYQIEQNHSCT